MLEKVKHLLLENISIRQTIAKNTFWLGFGEVMSRLLRALIVIVAARLLGPGEWGIFSYVINIAAMFTIVTDLGLNAVLVKHASREPTAYLPYLSTSLFIKIVLIIGGIALILGGGPLIARLEGAAPLLPIVAFILLFDGLREFLFSVSRALERMEKEAAAKILTNFLIAMLGLILLLPMPSAATLAWAYLIGSAVGFIYTAWILRDYVRGAWSHFRKMLVWPIMSEAWPFAMIGLFATIMTTTDIFLLGAWLDAREVGLYSAANRLIQLFYMFPAVFASALFPILARTAIKEPLVFRGALRKGMHFVLVGALPLMVGGYLLATPMMRIVFGIDFIEGYASLRILLLTLPIAFASPTIVNAMYAADKQRLFLWMLAGGAILNVILDIALIPTYGGPGSAAATLFAQIVSIVPGWIVLARTTALPILPRIAKPIIAVAAMGAVVYFITPTNINLFLIIGLGAAVYIPMLFLLRDETRTEFMRVAIKFNNTSSPSDTHQGPDMAH